MTYDYFYGQQAEMFAFYRVPKVLFTEDCFWNVSTDAKLLYGILLDRMNLSARNGWLDEEGRVYIIFTIEEIKGALGCAEKKAVKLLDELEMERRRIQAGAKEYQGHTYMDLARFDEATKHMIIFDVLTNESPVGWKGERNRLYLSEAGYQKALDNQKAGNIKIISHANVARGNLYYDRRDMAR